MIESIRAALDSIQSSYAPIRAAMEAMERDYAPIAAAVKSMEEDYASIAAGVKAMEADYAPIAAGVKEMEQDYESIAASMNAMEIDHDPIAAAFTSIAADQASIAAETKFMAFPDISMAGALGRDFVESTAKVLQSFKDPTETIREDLERYFGDHYDAVEVANELANTLHHTDLARSSCAAPVPFGNQDAQDISPPKDSRLTQADEEERSESKDSCVTSDQPASPPHSERTINTQFFAWMVLDKTERSTPHDRSLCILEFHSLWLPERVRKEDLGGFIEHINQLHAAGAPAWKMYMRTGAAVGWTTTNSLRELAGFILLGKAAKAIGRWFAGG